MRSQLNKVARVSFGLFLLAVPVLAHHGFDGGFDPKKKLKMNGVVNKVSWTNPHIHVYIDVTDKNGKVTTWRMEVTSPAGVQRQGWSKYDLLAGDKVTFEGYAGRVVETMGSLSSITKLGQDVPLYVAGEPAAAKEGRPPENVKSQQSPCPGCASPRGAGVVAPPPK